MSKTKGTKSERFELLLSPAERARLAKKAGAKSAAAWLRDRINEPFEDTYSRELKAINANLEEIKEMLRA